MRINGARQSSEKLGLEMEMAVMDAQGQSYSVTSFFSSLRDIKAQRGSDAIVKRQGGREIAVNAPIICSSVDNAFNNLESAIGPVAGGDGGLQRLHELAMQELEDISAALAEEGAAVLNFSEHPNVQIDPQFYAAARAPKPIYDYWVMIRGWNHSVGVDAKAQNGPTTAVDVEDAVNALNVTLATAPALIALYANSPFEGGSLTGLKENRLTIWPRMFATSVHEGDRRLQQLPERPFRDLRDYFEWMFGPGTAMHSVPLDFAGEYKSSAASVQIEGNPSLLEFLRGKSRQGRNLLTGELVSVRPSVRHLEYLQYVHFLDARIRYGLQAVPSTEEFFAAWDRPFGLEDLFELYSNNCYIESRAAGANFPDTFLIHEPDVDVARSCVISPSAIQAGLLRNLDQALELVNRWGWRSVAALRDAAIRSAMDGEADGQHLADFCREVLDVAEDGLSADERWMLAYPRYVCETGMTGADRAIALWESASVSNMQQLAQKRAIQLPQKTLAIPQQLGIYPAPVQLTLGFASPAMSS
jgi:glutamate-cysteine ligase